MNQDNMDNKIKNIFSSLSEKDLSKALENKERVWLKVQEQKKEKKTNQRWLLLLLGALLFATGWFLSPNQAKESVPLYKNTPEQQNADHDLLMALNIAKATLNSQQKSLDSLLALNVSLSDRILAINQNVTPSAVQQLKVDPRIIRDTILLTQVKVEERIIEKIIRDTITLEVPNKGMEAMAMVSENIPKERTVEAPIANESALPSSVQFNFSQTKIKDK